MRCAADELPLAHDKKAKKQKEPTKRKIEMEQHR